MQRAFAISGTIIRAWWVVVVAGEEQSLRSLRPRTTALRFLFLFVSRRSLLSMAARGLPSMETHDYRAGWTSLLIMVLLATNINDVCSASTETEVRIFFVSGISFHSSWLSLSLITFSHGRLN